VLRQQNQELSGRLKAAEGKQGSTSGSGAPAVKAGRPGGAAAQGAEGLRAEVERAKGARAEAVAEAGLSQLRLEAALSTLESQLLGADDVEAAALNCCWLARYWVSGGMHAARLHATVLAVL